MQKSGNSERETEDQIAEHNRSNEYQITLGSMTFTVQAHYKQDASCDMVEKFRRLIHKAG